MSLDQFSVLTKIITCKLLKMSQENKKKCLKCECNKDCEDFHKDKTSKDGLRSWCKICVKEYKKQNKEKSKNYSKKYRKNKKLEINSKKREKYKLNKEIIKERNKKYYQQKKKLQQPIKENEQYGRNCCKT